MKAVLSLLVTVALAGDAGSEAPTGEEILRRVDRNMALDQAVTVSRMVVHGRRGTRTIQSRSWVTGRDKALVEYLAPARERGKKMLKLGDMIWTYTPEPSDRIITISGHLLRQSVMGSDLSYEDMTENDRLEEVYAAEVLREEIHKRRPCWVLGLTAKTPGLAYYTRTVWVDAERWVPLREELYAKSGRLLKELEVGEVLKVGDRWYPKRMRFKDVLSKGKGTEYIIESIDFEADVPDYRLTKAALRR